jgi:hypothetical protein
MDAQTYRKARKRSVADEPEWESEVADFRFRHAGTEQGGHDIRTAPATVRKQNAPIEDVCSTSQMGTSLRINRPTKSVAETPVASSQIEAHDLKRSGLREEISIALGLWMLGLVPLAIAYFLMVE